MLKETLSIKYNMQAVTRSYIYSEWAEVARLCPTLCDPMYYTVHGILQATILEWVAFPFSRRSSFPGIEPRSRSLQADSLPAEPRGKPKNTGVASLSLLLWIVPTQELNQGLLHCRRILYQLSYQGSLLFMYYLCEKYYKPTTAQCYIDNCVS